VIANERSFLISQTRGCEKWPSRSFLLETRESGFF
jgi:hypothetical protein